MKTFHRHDLSLDYNDKYISKSDVRIYRNAVILTPGIWTDSVTMGEVEYTPKALSQYATNWTRNVLDLDHNLDVLSIVGTVESPRFYKNQVLADLHLNPKLDAGRNAITLIDAGLVNSLSVELLTEDRWNTSKSMREAFDIEFIGCAILAGHPARPPACNDTRIIQNAYNWNNLPFTWYNTIVKDNDTATADILMIHGEVPPELNLHNVDNYNISC